VSSRSAVGKTLVRDNERSNPLSLMRCLNYGNSNHMQSRHQERNQNKRSEYQVMCSPKRKNAAKVLFAIVGDIIVENDGTEEKQEGGKGTPKTDTTNAEVLYQIMAGDDDEKDQDDDGP